MKKNRSIWSLDIIVIALLVTSLVLAATVGYLQPILLIPAGIVFLAIFATCLFSLKWLRKSLKKLFLGKTALEAAADSGLEQLSLPVAALSEGRLVWYNGSFLRDIAEDQDAILSPFEKIVQGLNFKFTARPEGQHLALKGKYYTVHSCEVKADPPLTLMIFVENTELKTLAEKYNTSRPSILYFVIDTYDEVLKEMRESDRARIISSIDLAMEKYIGESNGLLRRVSSSRYLAVVEEQYMQKMIEERFSILDTVREAVEGTQAVTLSIGVGRQGNDFKECEEMALRALDMALGRGGDQAAVKDQDGFSFYGGLSRSVEKRNKVKSRIIAAAIKDLIGQYDRVLIMGHRNSDMDSIGGAVGMLRFCKICEKPAAIVVNEEKSLAKNLLERLNKAGYSDDILSPSDALSYAGSKTLLIVVDTHMKTLLESQEIYASCNSVVVIDHHRLMVGHIDNAIIFYHEPYASSTAELVTEMLQQIDSQKNEKLTPVEAEALLAGIMLDTRTFSLHVGVRTFEASAYLRRMGAQTSDVKLLFASSIDDYMFRSHLVSEAKIHLGCAVVVSDKVPFDSEVVAPQAANDLLTIEGVKASFVAIKQGDTVRISGRSMGEINVQLIMEKLGGGGHQTMAGAQLTGVNCEQAEEQLLHAIDTYMWENKPKLAVKTK